MIDGLSTAVALVTPPLPVTTALIAGVALTQRAQRRQNEAARAAAVRDRAEAATTELIVAATELHMALVAEQPRWNDWQPRLLTIGQSLLEFFAGREATGDATGVARAGSVAVDWKMRNLACGATFLREPYVRLTTAISRAALLPDADVVAAAMRTSEAAIAVMTAYGTDNLYRPRAAAAARATATTALHEAIADLITTVQRHLHPADQPPTPRWRRTLNRRE
ncbi:hypothetical protein MED01_001005 [Micromonospora sp. MED01]|uniref:hypothetical protein n=1 Tax=Micromonospora alfalfae TaxID=2911212 RepID=UPI001EE7903B|nr:hypothetical protein [Micromonospora alfalfae]MCG5462892.1 hypothetical protein [Micromonospora alfalfae]